MQVHDWTLGEDAMPGGCHPAYAKDADVIRQWLRRRNPTALRIPEYRGGPARYFELGTYPKPDMVTITTRLLDIKKVAAPAPFVGPKQFFWWYVAVDELGRCVASTVTYRVESLWHGWGYPSGWPVQWTVRADDDPTPGARY